MNNLYVFDHTSWVYDYDYVVLICSLMRITALYGY